MKFKVDKAEFEKVMGRIDSLVPSKDMQTLLSHVLVEIQDDKVSLTSSDMESAAQIEIAAENASPGSLIVSAQKMNEIARKLNSPELNFEANEEEGEESTDASEKHYLVKITGTGKGSARFQLTGGDPKHFPEFHSLSGPNMPEFDVPLLFEMIDKTMYAISHEDNRYIYNGLCFIAEGTKLTIVGTDGRRLSAITREFKSNIELADADFGDVVVHAKAIRQLPKLLGEETTVQIGIERRNIFFHAATTKLSSRLLEGKFPDYTKVVPTETNLDVEIDKEELLAAMRQIMVMAEPPSFQVKMQIENDTLTLVANTPDVGKADIQLPINSTGEELIIAFNATYLTDVLNSLNCQTVKMQFVNPDRPILVKDTSDPDFVALIMPMKI